MPPLVVARMVPFKPTAQPSMALTKLTLVREFDPMLRDDQLAPSSVVLRITPADGERVWIWSRRRPSGGNNTFLWHACGVRRGV